MKYIGFKHQRENKQNSDNDNYQSVWDTDSYQSVCDNDNYQSVWRQTHYDDTDKNNNVSFNDILTYIIPIITACTIRLDLILAIISILTFITADIL